MPLIGQPANLVYIYINKNLYSVFKRLNSLILIIALPKALLVQKKNIKLVFSKDYLAIIYKNIGKNKGTTDIQF